MKTKTLLSCMRGGRGGYRNLWGGKGDREIYENKNCIVQLGLGHNNFCKYTGIKKSEEC